MAVEENGRWYISPALTVAELYLGAGAGTWAEGYQYEEIPEPLGAKTPQQAAQDLAAGIESVYNLGGTTDLVSALPLVERRLLGLYLPSQAAGPSAFSPNVGLEGDLTVVSQQEGHSLLRPKALQLIMSDAGYSLPNIVKLDGLCFPSVAPEPSD